MKVDHRDYNFTAAESSLATIRERGYPLILASSKTRREMEFWQDVLGICDPFICENGAAVVTPQESGYALEVLAPALDRVLTVVHDLRRRKGYKFRGMSDCTLDEVIKITGLDVEQAINASTREYSEPLIWQDTEERKIDFLAELARQQLQAQQGGRFLTVAGICDKSAALKLVKQRCGSKISTTLIACGDSPNDEKMLCAADIAVVIKSDRSDSIVVEGPARILRTEGRGPVGWQEAMATLLAEFEY
jgi:mannosyl-3-phosphoglycerate phosphatase